MPPPNTLLPEISLSVIVLRDIVTNEDWFELGETLKQAVEREIHEETGLTVKAGEVCCVFDGVKRDADGRVQFHYVIVDHLADYVAGDPVPSSDAAEAAWFSAAELEKRHINLSTLHLLKKLDFIQAP